MAQSIEEEIRLLIDGSSSLVVDCTDVAQTIRKHHPRYSIEHLTQLVLAEVTRRSGNAAWSTRLM